MLKNLTQQSFVCVDCKNQLRRPCHCVSTCSRRHRRRRLHPRTSVHPMHHHRQPMTLPPPKDVGDGLPELTQHCALPPATTARLDVLPNVAGYGRRAVTTTWSRPTERPTRGITENKHTHTHIHMYVVTFRYIYVSIPRLCMYECM